MKTSKKAAEFRNDSIKAIYRMIRLYEAYMPQN